VHESKLDVPEKSRRPFAMLKRTLTLEKPRRDLQLKSELVGTIHTDFTLETTNVESEHSESESEFESVAVTAQAEGATSQPAKTLDPRTKQLRPFAAVKGTVTLLQQKRALQVEESPQVAHVKAVLKAQKEEEAQRLASESKLQEPVRRRHCRVALKNQDNISDESDTGSSIDDTEDTDEMHTRKATTREKPHRPFSAVKGTVTLQYQKRALQVEELPQVAHVKAVLQAIKEEEAQRLASESKLEESIRSRHYKVALQGKDDDGDEPDIQTLVEKTDVPHANKTATLEKPPRPFARVKGTVTLQQQRRALQVEEPPQVTHIKAVLQAQREEEAQRLASEYLVPSSKREDDQVHRQAIDPKPRAKYVAKRGAAQKASGTGADKEKGERHEPSQIEKLAASRPILNRSQSEVVHASSTVSASTSTTNFGIWNVPITLKTYSDGGKGRPVLTRNAFSDYPSKSISESGATAFGGLSVITAPTIRLVSSSTTYVPAVLPSPGGKARIHEGYGWS
jgi:hypothetical protein